MTSKPLSNRVALVTGASRGIGRATAVELAGLGAHVVVTARKASELGSLVAEVSAHGAGATCVPLDLCDEAAIAALAGRIDGAFGRLDILFGNAGVPGPNLSGEQVTVKGWSAVFTVNLAANWHLLRYLDHLLLRSDAGRAVFMSSSSVRQARAERGVYAASKAALESLIRAYAESRYDTPVRANLFNPGPVRTAMRAAVAPTENPMDLVTPDQCAREIVSLFMPQLRETGRFYDFPSHAFLPYPRPSKIPADVRNRSWE
jgi:NAD(P)-dependent dehydrogenase (short-subunit alcohol dehydrogenase family)